MLRPYLTMASPSLRRDGVTRERLEFLTGAGIAEHHLVSGARPDRAEFPTHQAGAENADAHDLEAGPFLERFGIARALHRGDRLDGVGAANRLHARFRHAEVPHLALRDQFLHRGRLSCSCCLFSYLMPNLVAITTCLRVGASASPTSSSFV